MSREIERKFEVLNNSWKSQVSKSMQLTQSYLNEIKKPCKSSIRIRVEDNNAYINIKSIEKGISRDEFEYPIPIEDANYFLKNFCCNHIVEKKRHLVTYADKLWSIDEFSNNNFPLVIAEIELNSKDEIFKNPPWLGKEITDDASLYNTSLSQNPFSSRTT